MKPDCKLLQKAFDIMKENCATPVFAMGAVVGLSPEEIRMLLSDNSLESLAIVNTNNKTCNILCGLLHELETFLLLQKRPMHFPQNNFGTFAISSSCIYGTGIKEFRSLFAGGSLLRCDCTDNFFGKSDFGSIRG